MQLGIFAKTFEAANPATVLAAVKSAGFATVQYNMACSGLAAMPDEIAPEVISDINAAVAQMGISVAALSATYNMIHPSTDERSNGHRRLGVLAKAAAACGIPMLTLCTGTRNADDQWAPHPQNTTRGAWRDLLHSMEIAVRYAEQYDLLLGVEPELANVISSAAKARQLLDEIKSPRIKIVLDPANLFEHHPIKAQRHIVSESIALLAPDIAMAHAKDRAASGEFVAAGKGVLDYAHFIRELKNSGFNGPLISHGLSAAEAPAVAKFLRGHLST